MTEQAYYRNILSETLLQDSVLAIIQVRLIGDLTGPISKPNTSSDRPNAVKILLDFIQEAGLVAGEFGPDSLFEIELGVVQAATQDLYESLKILVAEHVQMTDLNYQTGSSHYASATSEPDSDSPRAPQGMSLGPSGTKYLRSRLNRSDQRPAGPSRTSEKPDQQENRQIPAGRITPTTKSTGSSNKLDEYFQMAMNRFLKKQNLVTVQQPPLGTQDIDMDALIQTLLVEAGFSFRNVIPKWFRSRSSQVASSAVRTAVEGVQHLLAAELIEWRQVAFGVTFQVVDIQDEPLVIQDYHAEDADGDLLMTDHEAGLLGRECVLRLRMSGLRGLRSPRGSPSSEPDPKRQQHRTIPTISGFLAPPVIISAKLRSPRLRSVLGIHHH
ncbi:hypothetical protein PHMEG_00013524 [Phytophthora megakarya]|uniref:Uncharacterized protein n=1 Tax=Phytophthora megakarya TaxID=4795 RepID=A0A225W725_9STRA|nr:hypothetical protein PHMEG_00013524 [Phytophthora megakarya]